MMLSLLGTPSDLTAALLKVAQTLAQQLLGPTSLVIAGTAEEFRTAWAARAHEHVLLYGEIPDAEVAALLAAAQTPIVVVLDTPDVVVAGLVGQRRLELLSAVRFASQSYATLHDLSFLTTSQRVDERVGELPLSTVVQGLASVYGLECGSEALQRILADLSGGSDQDAPLVSLFAASEHSGAAALGMPAMGSLAGYRGLVSGFACDRFDWPLGVFIAGGDANKPFTGTIDLVGTPRCFIYGPYLHLPAGRWQARVEFQVRDNHSSNVLKIDVFSDRVLWEGRSALPALGTFACTLDFEVVDPRIALQIRFFIEQAALEGTFSLLSVGIDRAGPSPLTRAAG